MTKLLERFQELAQYETATITRFKQQLDKDPAYALTWGDDVFCAAAKLRVINKIINMLTDNEPVENIRDSLMDHVMHRSRFPSHSSSPTSNLIEQYELKACAQLVDALARYKFDY